MEFLLILCIVISAVSLILTFLLLTRKPDTLETQKLETKISLLEQQLKDQQNDSSKQLDRLKRDIVDGQKDLRYETSNLLKEMNVNVQKLTTNNLEQQNKMMQTVSATLNRLQDSNEKKLDQMRETVDEKLTSTLTTRLDSSFKTVSTQLENVYKSLGEMKELSAGVTDNVTSLNRVLTNVKARGTWAEVQLEALLDQTIPNMYEKNVATKKNSLERVEFAIKIPTGDNDMPYSWLPVDSKFPMEDYVRLCDAADHGDSIALEAARKALENRVKDEAKAVSGYIHVPETTPFAIMYLATEGLYAEIISSRSGLPEKIQRDYHVMIAGPSTINALLNSLSMGYKTMAINQKANEVWKILGAAKSQYDLFGNLLEKAHKKVEEAGKTLETAQHRNRMIQKKLKKVEELELEESSNLLDLNEDTESEEAQNELA